MNKLRVLLVLLSMSVSPAWGEGQARITFTGTCLPRIQDRADLLALLSAYDIAAEGTCQAVQGPASAPSTYSYPFTFPARLKGATGAYKFLLVIDYVSSLSDTHNRIIAGRQVPDGAIGIAIWPLAQPVPAP